MRGPSPRECGARTHSIRRLEGRLGVAPEQTPRSPWLVTGVLALVGTGMIHAAAMPAHLREWWVAGLFFAGISAAEFCLGFLALSVASRRLWLLAVGLSVATMAVWAFSRIWGMPVGPRAWQREAVGWPDYSSTVLEAITAGAFLALASPAPEAGRRRSLALAVAGMVIVTVLTGIALWSLHRRSATPLGPTVLRAAPPDPTRRPP